MNVGLFLASVHHMRSRGFTLVELLVTLAVAGALLAISGWAGVRMVINSRSAGAARQFQVELRNAAGAAARTNRPLQVIVSNEGTADCNPSWRTQTIPNVGEETVVYSRTCLNLEFPGVSFSNGSIASSVTCTKDAGAAQLPLTNCSLCSGTGAITVYPSGEVRTPSAVPNGATLIFTPRGASDRSATIAVGVRDSSGQTRIYRPNSAGTSWECP